MVTTLFQHCSGVNRRCESSCVTSPLSGEGNENGEKATIGLISKRATLHVQHTFFVHFFAVVLHDYNVKLSETSWLRFMEEMSYVFLFIFFSLPLIFTLVTARISYIPTAATTFSCCSRKKKCLLCLLTLAQLSVAVFLVELRWLSLSLCLALSLCSKFVDMTINLSFIL